MMRVNCLYRVSSKQQLHDGDIPVQRAECMAFINTMEGWKFQKEYSEQAISGFKTPIEKRKVLQDILSDAKEKKFDILLVYMSDRIGRKENESSSYVTALNALGIEVWSVKEGQLKTEEHIDKLLNYIRFWQAEGESRKTGMRVKSAQETMARSGRFVGGYAPLGYDLVYSGEMSNHGRALKKLIINEEKAKIVRLIYEYAVNYGYGAFKIAKILNENKVEAPNDTWKSSTISQILQNPVYKGYITYNRRERSKCGGNYEKMPMDKWILADKQNPELVIVPEKIWNKVQELRENRKSSMKNARDNGHGKYQYSTSKILSLTGLIYCGYCGCRLTNGSKYDYWETKDGEKKKRIIGKYRCTNKANATGKCKGKTAYRADEIEPIVFSAVTSYLNSLKEADICDDIMKIQEKNRESIKRELKAIEKQIDNVKKDIETLKDYLPQALRGEVSFKADELHEMINKKKESIASLQMEYDKKQDEYKATEIEKEDLVSVGNVISNWGELFMECSVPEKRQMLSRLIERIDVFDSEIKIKFRISMNDYWAKTIGSAKTEQMVFDDSNLSRKTSDSPRIPCIPYSA